MTHKNMKYSKYILTYSWVILVNISSVDSFFSVVSCAPPVGHYDVKDKKKLPVVSFGKSDRFQDPIGKC